MSLFEEGYARLNAAQKKAVDTIEGPVLVVAGPGTGKTQLLSMRAANILHTTDVLPANILCLTFTESAALAMRKRLISLMGPEGNRVAVHTFHNFGADIINRHSEYFYNGARFAPADPMTSHDLLQGVFANLAHSNPLAKTMNGEFTAQRDVQSAISHLKRAGITPDELLAVLRHNEAFCDAAEPLLSAAFAARLSKKDLPVFASVAEKLALIPAGEPLRFAPPLATICTHSFAAAVAEAEASGKTTALTGWRNEWMEKNAEGEFVFKERARCKKLRALAKVQARYGEALATHELFDFDDMVTLVAHTLEHTPELRFNLQEQYQYIMVDEFQDTNGAQLRLLRALTDNPVHEGRPNVLAVGDDDQAVYGFQGAELSNITGFHTLYRQPTTVTLTDNYRSTQAVLDSSRQVIVQCHDRLETTLPDINKLLTAHSPAVNVAPELHEFTSSEAEYNWLATAIKQELATGTPASEIAVIARTHKQLTAVLPYLHAAGITAAYERRSDVLQQPQIRQLITLAEVIVAIGDQQFDKAESLLPELLSYEFWGLTTAQIWDISLQAHKQRRMWLEIMLESDGKPHDIGQFLVVAAHKALHEPLEKMLDILLGTDESQVSNDDTSEPFTSGSDAGPSEDFSSPFRAHYFTAERLADDPASYLTLLSNLRALRTALCNYHPGEVLSLASFIDFIDLHEQTGTPIMDIADYRDDTDGVILMTAHKSKGLEFDTVHIINSQDDVWGRTARHRHSSVQFPHNLPIEPAGSHYDDAVRLYFVAMTRAKQRLLMSYATADASGKEHLRAEFLQAFTVIAHDTTAPPVSQLVPGWEARHVRLPVTQREILLAPLLENYCLSATHVTNFLDVTRGGPQAFLLQNLLRFPQAMTREQVFGQAIHAVLQRAHTHLAATGERRPVEDILRDFEIQLHQSHLTEQDTSYLAEKGSDVLQHYLSARYDSFTPQQKAERNFANQHVTLGHVRLTGAIDLLETHDAEGTITVTDYKTGKGTGSWRGSTEYEKIKLHKYQQQLMVYKLLVEHSRDYGDRYTVERGIIDFVEATPDGQLHSLDFYFDPAVLARFTKLLTVIWQHIMKLDFPDTSSYEQSLKGILAFEEDLLSQGDLLA